MHEQANILVENRPDVVSLHMMWDGWCLTNGQVEALLRGVEEGYRRGGIRPGRSDQGSPLSPSRPDGSASGA
jgi:hypothetical protein